MSNELNLVETTFDKIDIDKIRFRKTWSGEYAKTQETLSLKNYKAALKYMIKKYPGRLKIYPVDDSNNTYHMLYGFSNYNSILYNDNLYLISGFSDVWKEMSLSEFIDLKFSNSVIDNLCMTHRTKYDMKDYDKAVELVTEGKVQFINLFGVGRYPVKTSDDLLAMMKSKNFFSTKSQPMCGRSYGEANIAAAFNYHCHLFNKDIFDFLMSFMSEKDKPEYHIIKRVKDKLKKAKIERENIPDEFLLFLEIAD